jgi:hypothetical protein
VFLGSATLLFQWTRTDGGILPLVCSDRKPYRVRLQPYDLSILTGDRTSHGRMADVWHTPQKRRQAVS